MRTLPPLRNASYKLSPATRIPTTMELTPRPIKKPLRRKNGVGFSFFAIVTLGALNVIGFSCRHRRRCIIKNHPDAVNATGPTGFSSYNRSMDEAYKQLLAELIEQLKARGVKPCAEHGWLSMNPNGT